MTQFYWAIQFMVIKCLLRNNKMKKKINLVTLKFIRLGPGCLVYMTAWSFLTELHSNSIYILTHPHMGDLFLWPNVPKDTIPFPCNAISINHN